jgi:hypothetical protein
MNPGRSNDRIDGWWSKPPQDSGQRALVGQRKDPVKETDEPQLAAQRVSLDNADAFIDVLCVRSLDFLGASLRSLRSLRLGVKSYG